jgi:hypothetical protein
MPNLAELNLTCHIDPMIMGRGWTLCFGKREL